MLSLTDLGIRACRAHIPRPSANAALLTPPDIDALTTSLLVTRTRSTLGCLWSSSCHAIPSSLNHLSDYTESVPKCSAHLT